MTLKGAVLDFVQSPYCTSDLSSTCALMWPCGIRVQVTCCTSFAYMQRIMCLMVRRDSSATTFYRTEIAVFFFFLALAGYTTQAAREICVAIFSSSCFTCQRFDDRPHIFSCSFVKGCVEYVLWFGLLDHRGWPLRAPASACVANDCSVCYIRYEA